MIVLSLFDGISCGYIALERIRQETKDFPPIEKYFASEIDETAIHIATYNHADIIEIGDIRKVCYDKERGLLHTEQGTYIVDHIDLLMGGSPCTDFSAIGCRKGMRVANTPICSLDIYLEMKQQGYTFEGESYLFWEFVRLLQEINPTYFLLENVIMAKKWREIIDMTLGENPIEINSSLVSAQWRRRQYWTNIPNVTLPEDKHIILDQILDQNADTKDCSAGSIVQKNLPKLIKKYGILPFRFNAYNATEITDKACTLTKGSMVSSSCATLMWVKVQDGVHIVKQGIMDNTYPVELPDGRYNLRRLNFLEMERLQTIPEGYTDMPDIGVLARGACIGNAWTVDVIAHILQNMRFK